MDLICSNAEFDAYRDGEEVVIVASGDDPSRKKAEVVRVDLLDTGVQESLAAFTQHAIAAARAADADDGATGDEG